MKYFKYDSNSLRYIRVNPLKMILKYTVLPAFFITILMSWNGINNVEIERIGEEERIIILRENGKFTKEKLIDEITRMNFRFPHIVLAQAEIESGHFKSAIFRENNNMFGMREARVRANLARGTRRNHAYYDTWKESLYDYGLYYSRYLSTLKTEEEYYQYINEVYAEAPDYGVLVKKRSEGNRKYFE